ncbi:MAG: response regulator [bacterium]|nr:response regulator [bacterium]
MARLKKVLIIEDDPIPRNDIKRVFTMDEEFDFQVYESVSFEEAKKISEEKRRFDLLVIDWRLASEENGGLDALKNLKIFFPKIKIVYTAHATLENCVKAMKAGANNYIDKTQPGSLEKLLESAKEELRARKFDDNEPDNEWLNEHLEELSEKYSGELIAFIDGQVVDHGKSKQKLIEKVKEKYPDDEPYIMFAPVEDL